MTKQKNNLVLKHFSPEEYFNIFVDFSSNPEYRYNLNSLAKKNKIKSSKLGYWIKMNLIKDFSNNNTQKSAYVPFESQNKFLI